MLAWMSFAPAEAQEAPAEEIVVWGDLFARWDGTRWFVQTEVGTPWKVTFNINNEYFATQEFQLRTVLACEKDWKLGNHRFEVHCSLEDFGLVASLAERNVTEADVARSQRILDLIDAQLTGAAVELQVADDGRVTNLQLVGVERDNRRESLAAETMRQILSRVVVGFNLKMQKYNQLHEGKWTEFNSTLMTLPMPQGVPGSIGSSMMNHYLNRYQGHVIVQTIGRGSTDVDGQTYGLDMVGVSVFDDDEGFMTERVWALEGRPTAGVLFSAASSYFHGGRVQMLGSEDHPSVGPTRPVNGRHQSSVLLPAWEPLERP